MQPSTLKTRATVAAAATLILTVGAAPAAHANLLLYAETSYRALIGNFSSPMSGPHNISAVNNDTLSSFQNQTPYSVAFWHDSNGTGWCFSGSPWQNAPSFALWDDNKASSFQLGRSC